MHLVAQRLLELQRLPLALVERALLLQHPRHIVRRARFLGRRLQPRPHRPELARQSMHLKHTRPSLAVERSRAPVRLGHLVEQLPALLVRRLERLLSRPKPASHSFGLGALLGQLPRRTLAHL